MSTIRFPNRLQKQKAKYVDKIVHWTVHNSFGKLSLNAKNFNSIFS